MSTYSGPKWFCDESKDPAQHLIEEKVAGDSSKHPGAVYLNCKRTNGNKRCDFFMFKDPALNKWQGKTKAAATPAEAPEPKKAKTEDSNHGTATFGASDYQLRLQHIEKSIADLEKTMTQKIDLLTGLVQLGVLPAKPAAGIPMPNQ
ncbi:MAG TPA: hypothetical protein VFC02_13010 [Anaerolineales bacterium]|nr:hypothetical protein [Anaerolineales bacterium]